MTTPTPTKDRRAEAEGWGNRPDAFQPKWDIGRDQYGTKIYALDGLIAACQFAKDGPADEEFDDGLMLEHWATLWLPRLQEAMPTSWIPGTPEERMGLLKVVEDFVLYEEGIGDFGGWDQYTNDANRMTGMTREDCDEDVLDRWLVYNACLGISISLDPTAFDPKVRSWTVVDSRTGQVVDRSSTEKGANKLAAAWDRKSWTTDRYSVVPAEPT